jgi:hypothetical protein
MIMIALLMMGAAHMISQSDSGVLKMVPMTYSRYFVFNLILSLRKWNSETYGPKFVSASRFQYKTLQVERTQYSGTQS